MSDKVVPTIAAAVEDAEKIAVDLIPPGSRLAQFVGVLAQHVAELKGGTIGHLADEALGIVTDAATAEATASDNAKIAALEAELDGGQPAQTPAQKRIAELEAEIAAKGTPATEQPS